MMNPIAIMTSLNMQSMSLLLSGCPSYSSTRAGPRSPTTRSKTLHLGHTHFSIPSSPISSGFIHGYPFRRSNSWQRFNKGVVRAKKQSEESVVQSSERAKEAEEKPKVQEDVYAPSSLFLCRWPTCSVRSYRNARTERPVLLNIIRYKEDMRSASCFMLMEPNEGGHYNASYICINCSMKERFKTTVYSSYFQIFYLKSKI